MESKSKKRAPAASSAKAQDQGTTTQQTTNAAAPADPQQQVRDLEAQVKKLTDIAGRAQADLQNAKARLERDAQEMRTFAAGIVIQRLLPTIDSFQRAFQHLPDDLKSHEWVKGITAIEQELMRQMKDLGLRRMDVLGQKADPARHEVLMQGPGPSGLIVEVFEEGYELNGKVLRPAKVKVGDGTTEAVS